MYGSDCGVDGPGECKLLHYRQTSLSLFPHHQLESEYVVQLAGVVTAGKPVLMVIEYAEYGSLETYLRDNDTPENLKLQWAGDVAEGVAHVHEKGFLHRDIAARNVLISSKMRCKVRLGPAGHDQIEARPVLKKG